MTKCSACFFGGVTIENKGPEDSQFVIVGESPGILEIHYRKPFVGESGKALQQALEQQGLGDIEPYYTNAIMCLPRKKTPESLQSACASCHDRLVADITKYPRKVILALGNGAIWSLLGNMSLKITKERGKLFKTPLAEIGIVSAVHPAFLLRGGGNFKQFQQDLKYAIDLYRDGTDAMRVWNGTKYRVLSSMQEAKRWQEELQDQKKGTDVAVDIETTGFEWDNCRILEVGFQHRPDLITIVPRELLLPGHFQPHTNQIWHNGKFDCRFLHYYGCPGAVVNDDTMLMSYTLNERRGIHDLDQVASDWLGSPNHKQLVSEFYKGKVIDAQTGLKRQRNLGDAPLDLRYKYLASDMSDTYNLAQTLRPEIEKSPDLTRFYREHLVGPTVQTSATTYLLKVEKNGILVDQKWVHDNNARLMAEMDKFKAEFQQAAVDSGFGDVNMNSPKQLGAFLYGHLKLAPISWATDKETLEELFEMHPKVPAIQALKGYRTVAKSWSTYVRPLFPRGEFTSYDAKGKEKETKSFLYDDGKVHQTYLLHGTATSRLSCRDPNAQNVPRDPLLRGMFIPRPGYGILEVDYSQAELRSLAVLSRCPDLMAIFLTGKDLHVELSIFLFGPNFTREDKMKAKTVNFGIVYGRTAPSIADAFDVTIAEAQSWIDGWFRRFPVAAKFIEKCRMAPVLSQTITTAFGNKKRPGLVGRDKIHDVQNESANFPHQSIASNLTVRAGAELFDTLRDKYDTHIINTVHDCIVTETPLDSDHIKLVSDIIVHKMEDIPKRYRGLGAVPFRAEPEFGLRWGNLLKFKEIEKDYSWDISKIPDYVAAH